MPRQSTQKCELTLSGRAWLSVIFKRLRRAITGAHHKYRIGRVPVVVSTAVTAILGVAACRPTTDTTTTTSGADGGSGSDYVVQCSGWFPDWIARSAPPAGVSTFRLAQGYPLGIPIVGEGPNGPSVMGWDPPGPFSSAPWLSFDFKDPTERMQYLKALKDYALDDLVPYDFVPQNSSLAKKHWYHVPMMTSGIFPREPLHGLTRERSLRAGEQTWLSSDVGAFGIGLYNSLGGYTIGRVFDDPEPSHSNAGEAQFIDGTLVLKVLFAEYEPSSIVGPDPLANAPEWKIQDPTSTSNATFPVRLIQMDIAVKDPRSTSTGWVFATYVYNESLPAAAPQDRWYNLTPVGLQWGNDSDVDGPNDPDLDESWINPSVPVPFNDHVGLHGRLNGPVDNPESACMSCHSTAQVRDGATSVGAYTAARMVPDEDCGLQESLYWFRSIAGSEPFGQMTGAPDYCAPASPPVASPPMRALDYSLQIQRGLVNGVALNHENPCQSLIPPDHLPNTRAARIEEAMRRGDSDESRMELSSRARFERSARIQRSQGNLPEWRAVGMELDPADAQAYPGR